MNEWIILRLVPRTPGHFLAHETIGQYIAHITCSIESITTQKITSQGPNKGLHKYHFRRINGHPIWMRIDQCYPHLICSYDHSGSQCKQSLSFWLLLKLQCRKQSLVFFLITTWILISLVRTHWNISTATIDHLLTRLYPKAKRSTYHCVFLSLKVPLSC